MTPTNVLLVTIDTLRWDALGSYGGLAATPALDRLADTGVRFEKATAHAVVTLPSHVSILTGSDPSRHGVHNNTGFRAGEELLTWAERLKAAGYATGAFIGAFPLDSQFGLAQGFDLYDDYYGAGSAASDFTIVERPGEEVVAAARRWIGEQGDRLWFAWVHVYDPHAPYEPGDPFASRYPDNPYAGEVAATDAALAPLFDDLVGYETLIVVTSDHGESLGQHGELTHGLFAYDATLRVPLIFSGTEHLSGGLVVRQWVRHIDILPTVLDQLGLPAEGVQGRPLTRLLAGGSPAPAGPSPAYFEALTPYVTRNWAPLRGIRRGSSKFIDLPLPELYDLEEDPAETENLATRDPERVIALGTALQEHIAEGEGSTIRGLTEESAATLERLRSLGYLGSVAQPGPEREFGPEDDPKRLVTLDQKIHEAVNASREGDWQSSAATLREVVAARPDFSWAHSLLASAEYRQGNLPGAISHLQGVIRGGLAPPFLLNKLAVYLREAGRFDEARGILDRSIAAEPENLETLSLLGAVYERIGEGDAALRIFREALALDPTYAPVHANYGIALLSLGREDEATAALEKALQYDRRLPEAHNGLGIAAARRDDQEEAIKHWRAAVELDADLFDAQYNLGITLIGLNRFAEATPVLEAFVDRAPPERYAEDIDGVRRLLQRLRRAARR